MVSLLEPAGRHRQKRGRGGVAVCYRVVRSVILPSKQRSRLTDAALASRGLGPFSHGRATRARRATRGAVPCPVPGSPLPGARESRSHEIRWRGVRVCGCGHVALFILYNTINEG